MAGDLPVVIWGIEGAGAGESGVGGVVAGAEADYPIRVVERRGHGEDLVGDIGGRCSAGEGSAWQKEKNIITITFSIDFLLEHFSLFRGEFSHTGQCCQHLVLALVQE